VKVAHLRLCDSRMAFVLVHPRESQEMVFDALVRAFEFFKGRRTRGIYDNMSTAVETVFTCTDGRFNRRFLRMCKHYLVEPTAVRRRRARRRGKSRTKSATSASGCLYRACE
jgi:transposase